MAASHKSKPNVSLIALALTCSFLLHDVAALAETRAESKSNIVLDFPQTSIGTLERIIDGADYSDEHSPGTTFARLTGKVSIAPNTILGVTVRDSLSDPVPVLARIPANLVQSLTLTGLAKFDEDTVKSILRFKNIRRLQLDRAELDDAGLARLASLRDLESIVISHTQVRGTTFSTLCSLKKLTHLDIGSNDIKGEALPALACLKRLQFLSIGRCHLRNPHLAFIAELPELKQLELFDNALLSDTCMKYVSHLKKLKTIKIDGTHISQKGLLMLKGAPLRHVRVNANMLSAAETAEVEKLFPGVKVKANNTKTKNYGIFKELFEKEK